jgi:hypothetical protein
MPRDLFQEAGITPSRRDAQGGRDLFAEAGISIGPKTRSFTDEVSDLGTAVWQGAKSTGRALSASLDTALDDRAAVEQTAGVERAAVTEQPSAQRALMDEIARRKALDTEPGVLSAIRNVGAAMLNNKSGSAQFVASQLPNTAVSLGTAIAGAKGGGALGALTGPFAPIAVPVLGTAGFLGGMFLGNTALETGSKAIDKAADGFTESERSDALREGAIKGGVITGIDAATLGLGGKLAKTFNRASAAAGRSAPGIGTRAAQLGTGIALETVGEGTGEYFGELAATGKPDVYDAVLESAAGLSQSVPQALWSVRRANVRPLNTEPPSASVNAPQPSTEPQNPSINASRQEPINQKPRNNDQSVLPSQTIESDTSALSADQSAPDQRTADQRTADQSQADQISSADPNLQNRDRSRLASVAQMQSIARAPDYMRLGPSRTPDSGAPMVFAQGDDLSAIPEQHFGKSDVAVMADGQRVPFQYAVVSADAVQASHNLDGSVNAGFSSEQLGTLKALNNGRVAGLRGAYEQGKAAIYQAELVSDAANHGIDPAAIALTPNPVLIRIYSEQSNTANMAQKSQGQGLGMSPVELARQDAKLMDSGVLSAYEEGDVSSADNRDFVRAFVGKLAGSGQDIATLMTAQGHLSPAGRTRIQAALAQAAFDDSDLVAELFDAMDTDIKGIGEALKQVAGHWANMRDSARIGAIDPQQDVTKDLMDAVGLIKRARQERRSLYELLRQPDLQTGQPPSDSVQAFVKLFYQGEFLTRPVAKDKAAAKLKAFVDQAMQTKPEPGFFGEAPSALDNLQSIAQPAEDQPGVSEEESVYKVRQPDGPNQALAGFDLSPESVTADLFPDSLSGQQDLPVAVKGRVKRSSKRSDNDPKSGSTQASAEKSGELRLSLRPDPYLPGIYHYSSQLVQVGTRSLPVDRIHNWTDAASALAALGQYAVEHFDVLITDQAGKPLAVIGSFKGAFNQASVYPNTLLAEALRIEGAAKAWGVHNHPSGISTLSRADQQLSRAISATFDASSVKWQGVAAIGVEPGTNDQGRFEAVDDKGNPLEGALITGKSSVKVPIVERTILRQNALMPAITSPDSAMSIMRSIAPPDTPGILFTDSQQRVSAFVPIKPEEANSLRIDQRFDRLVNAASEAGAGAAIIANPDAAIDFDGQSNLATALARLDIRLLDVIDVASRTSAVNQGHMPRDQGTVNDLSRKALERRMRHLFDGYEEKPTPKVQAARRLQGLIAKLDDGALSPEEFEVKVRRLAGELDEVVQTKANKRAVKPRQRGEPQLRERLIRAQRQGDLEPETVAFAFWALDQNPALATNLSISIQTPKSEGTAGQYNPTVELMRLFKGADARETAVHELLHHAERMMPKAMQEGIRKAWAQAYTRALEVAGAEERQALSLVPLALAGDRSAHAQLQAAMLDGPLNYADHYQLVNPSEYWAVNASALLTRRFDAKDRIFKQIAVWLSEMIEKVKGILGLESDTALLKALKHILDPAKTSGEGGYFLSSRMLMDFSTSEVAFPNTTLNDLDRSGGDQSRSNADQKRQSNSLGPESPTPNSPVPNPPTPNSSTPNSPNRWQALKTRLSNLISPQAIDALLYEFQDKYIDLKRIRDRIQALGGVITDLNDAYLGEELFHKRVAFRTQQFLSHELKPLLQSLHDAGIALKDFERYLHARHAPEANAAMVKRNPSEAELETYREEAAADVASLERALQAAKSTGGSTQAIEESLTLAIERQQRWSMAQAFKGTEDERLSLSGMSDAEAAQIIAGINRTSLPSFEAAAARVDAINEKTLTLLDAYGLMDAETLAAWRKAYDYYVPLHRDEAHPTSTAHPVGLGFSVKGAAARQRVGSKEQVTNILGHIAQQRETALTRGEKDRVTKKLYLMAAQNPDGSLWAVDKPPTVRVLDPMTNTVRTIVDPNYRNLPYVVMLRIGGKDAAITFNERNPEALRLAQSIKNLDVGDLHAAISLIAKGTRWFASINTQYNPIFGIINFARDLQSGLLNLSTTAIAGKEKEVAANVWPALKAIYRTERGRVSVASQDQSATNWANRWQQLQAAGGTTGYRDLFADAKERADALARELAALDRGAARKAAHAVLDWLSDYNEAMENAMRLSAFDMALNSGLSQERAASLAKNLTVNFNRKGRQSREIGALYAFFNASIQGTARMAQTLKGPLGRKIMLGGVMLGAVNTLLAMAIMGGGDDGNDAWEKIPEFVKEKNLIIPISTTEYLSLPLPLGFHFLPNIGRLSVEMMAGGRDNTPAKQLGNLLQVLLDAFNPLGGTQSFSQLVTPTVADPAVALAQNQDWTGRPIYRENHNPLNPQPGTALVKDSATPWSKIIAQALNRISGGTAYQPGAWSPTPDQIDYVIGQLTGGVGREIGKLAQTISAPFTGDELPAHKIPLLGRLYGSTQGVSGESELFYKNIKRLNQIENEYKGRMKAGEDAESFRQQEPLVDHIGLGNQAEAALSKLRQLRREVQLRADPGWQERVKGIDQQIEEVMREVNRRVPSELQKH